MFVVENIPVITCPHCGESYLEAEILHEIERIRVRKKGVTTPGHWSYDV
jgi:hypothetical protein